MYIILAIIIFGLLIAVHEFGHFIVAKACGIQVNEFSIGMGPLIFHKEGKETVYSLRLLPIGGFCAMEAEDEVSDNPRAFTNAKRWKQFLVLIAGAGFNFISGLLILLLLYSNVSTFATTTITGFADGFPCEGESMLMVGDEILSIDGSAILIDSDISTILNMRNKETVDIVVKRDGEKITIKDLPLIAREYANEDGTTTLRYGLNFGVQEANIFQRLKYGFYEAIDFVRMVWWSLEMIISGAVGLQNLSGPVGIVNTMNEVGEQSATILDAVLNLLYLGAFISINLAVMNLLPIPALDGGRVFFVLINSVLNILVHKTIPQKYEKVVHAAGMLLLLALMAVIALHDVYTIVSG